MHNWYYDWEDSCGEHTAQEHCTREYILACSLGRQFGNRVGIMGYFRTPMRFCSSNKVLALFAALILPVALRAVTENPVVRLHGRDLTFLLTFDDGTAGPDVGLDVPDAERIFAVDEVAGKVK